MPSRRCPGAAPQRTTGPLGRGPPADRRDLRIGVGVPGPLDPVEGVVFDAPNVPGWLDIPLKALLQQHFNVPILLGNDANVGALAEWRYGAARGCDDMLYLTISTGIGGGVIANGRLVLGANGLAGELGHMLVNPGGALCGCGQHGHLEAEAAGPATARQVQERIDAGERTRLIAT